MSLKSEIEANYVDANGLVCNRKCSNTEVNPSGNGVCYTGEYTVLCEQEGETLSTIGGVYNRCMVAPGLLSRGPRQPDLESVDDYYGFAAACKTFGAYTLANKCLDYGWANYGCFNNVQPGVFTWQSFLWRQPQLLCALYSASDRAPLWIYPFRLITALVIATSCISAPLNDCDSRRLAFLLIKTMEPTSFLCRLAAKIWWSRLRKQYGDEGMRAVAAQYYEAGHPFIKYWKNAWEV